MTDPTTTVDPLIAGQKLWFALDGPRLFLGNAITDPNARDFERKLRVSEPLSDDAHLGTGAVDVRGRLRLQGPELTSFDLLSIAQRARAEGWNGLTDLQLDRVDADGNVVATAQDPKLWSGLDTPVWRGTAKDLAHQIHTLAPGQMARTWATAGGEGVEPFMVLTPVDGDPDGTLDRAVRRGAKLTSRGAPGERAVLQRLSSGALFFTAVDDPASLADILRAVVTTWGPRFPAIWALAGARVVRQTDADFEGVRVTPFAELRSVIKGIAAIADTTQTAAFWFTTRADDGLPALRLAKKPEALAEVPDGRGATIRGALRWVDGVPHLEASAPPKLLGHFAGWVALHRPDHPPLAALERAVLLRTDAGGAVEERIERPELWPTAPQT